MNFWFISLTTRQVISIIIGIAIAIFVVWYVIDALEGFDPNYRPGMDQGGSRGEPKESYGAFDPSKKKTTSGQSTTLGIDCEYDSVSELVSCSANRTSEKSSLTWQEDNTAQTSEEENFEFSVSGSDKTQIKITLEECLGTACNEVTETVNISN